MAAPVVHGAAMVVMVVAADTHRILIIQMEYLLRLAAVAVAVAAMAAQPRNKGIKPDGLAVAAVDIIV